MCVQSLKETQTIRSTVNETEVTNSISTMTIAQASHARTNVREAEKMMKGKREHEEKKKDSDVMGEKKLQRAKAEHTSWLESPILWAGIRAAGDIFRPQMRPQEIVQYLHKTQPHCYLGLTPQVLGRWIDRTIDPPNWTEKTLTRVSNAFAPTGNVTRVGILVSPVICWHVL
jgi:phage protein D